MHRTLIPLIFGLAGVAVLVWLGVWQAQRLVWKEGVLADIEAHIAADPVPLPLSPDPEAHRYLPVQVSGVIAQNPIRVLVSRKQVGAGYRLITRLDMADRPILIDLGFIKVDQPVPDLPRAPLTFTGNLHWPDDRNSSTPENDLDKNIWFARDINLMADVMQAEPILVVARKSSLSGLGVTPLPVDTASIPNDHLSYAITWFSLAAIWAVMTAYFLWRTRRPQTEA